MSFSEDPESEITSTSTKGAEEEMDKSLLDEVDDDMSTGSNANAVTGDNTGREKPATMAPTAPTTKESAGERSGSVASLSQRFMANVTVGSNDVFTAPKNHANTTIPPNSHKAAEKQDLRGGATKGIRDGPSGAQELAGSVSPVRHRATVQVCPQVLRLLLW